MAQLGPAPLYIILCLYETVLVARGIGTLDVNFSYDILTESRMKNPLALKLQGSKVK